MINKPLHEFLINPFMPGVSHQVPSGPLTILEITHSCLEINLTSVVWTCHTFENIFGIKHKFTKYFKESCRWSSNKQFSFKYFLNITSVREIPPKLSGGFGCYRHEWDNFVINQKFTKKLKESYELCCYQHFSFKYSPKTHQVSSGGTIN